MSRRSVYAGSHARRKPRTRKGRKIQRFPVSSRRPLEMLPLVNIAAIEAATIATTAPARAGCAMSADQPPQPQAASPM